jgi:SSS family solute:Na+ symporter
MFFAGMLGAILAATVGYTFVSGTTLGRDFVGRLVPNATEHMLNQYTRYGIAIASLSGILIAWLAQSVITLWYSLPSIVIPGLLVPILGAYLLKRPPLPSVALACMAAGSLSAAVWTFWPKNPLAEQMPALTPIVVGLLAALLAWGIGSATTDGNRKPA